jgi:adenylate cyclase
MHECNQGWAPEPEAARDRSLEFAEQAVALDASLAAEHETLSYAYSWKKRYDEAVAEAERAISLDASAAHSYATLGEIHTWIGEPEKTIPLIDNAMSLNPVYPSWYLSVLGSAYFTLRRYGRRSRSSSAAWSETPTPPATTCCSRRRMP